MEAPPLTVIPVHSSGERRYDRQRAEYVGEKSYRPVGLLSPVVGGLIAGMLFKQVWRRAAPGKKTDPPTALEIGCPFKEILAAAAVQGVLFSVLKTVIDRQRARIFEKWTGEWPGR